MHILSDKGCKGTVVNMTKVVRVLLWVLHTYMKMEGYFKLRLLSTLPVIEKKSKKLHKMFLKTFRSGGI